MKKLLLAAVFLACQGMFAVESVTQDSPYYQKRITLIGYPQYPFTNNTKIFASPTEQRQAYQMRFFSYETISQESADNEMKKINESGINFVIAEDNRYIMRGIGEDDQKIPGLNAGSLEEMIENAKKVIAACHKNNMQFINHITCTMVDSGLFKKHPDWAVVDMETGKTNLNQYGTANSCINNDDFVNEWFKRLEKLCKETNADGIMIDEIQFFGPFKCGCKWCRDKFKKETGYELPENGNKNWFSSSNPAYRRWLDWRCEKVTERLLQSKELVKKHNPNAAFLIYLCNNTTSWSYYATGMRVNNFIKYADSVGYECEPHDYFYQYYWPHEIMEMKYLRAIAENIGTGMWTLFYEKQLGDYTINWFCSMSQGSRRWWRMHEVPNSEKAWQPLLAWEVKHRDILMNTISPANIGVLFSLDSRDKNPLGGATWMKGFAATCNALTNGHIPYKVIIDEDMTAEKLEKKVKTLVLFNTASLSAGAVQAIREFVKNGGNLICSGNVSLCNNDYKKLNDFALADVLGFSYAGETKEGKNLIIAAKNEITGDISGRFKYPGSIIQVKDLNKDVKVLGKIIDEKGNEYPGLLWRKCGKGNVIYFAGSPEMRYFFHYYNDNLIKPGKMWKDYRDPEYLKLICNTVTCCNQDIPLVVQNVPQGVVVEAYKHQFKDMKGIQVHVANFLGGVIKEGTVPVINEITFPEVRPFLPDPNKPILLKALAPETKNVYLISPDFDATVELPFKKEGNYACVELPDFYRYFILYFSEGDDSEFKTLNNGVVTKVPPAKKLIVEEKEALAGKYDPEAVIVFADDTRFSGGKKGEVWRLKEPCSVLYGTKSDVSSAIVNFEINKKIQNPVLEIGAMDDNQSSKAPIEIKFNGKTVFKGDSTFPDADWAVRSFNIKAEDVKEGQNTVEINNTGAGPKGNIPWLAISFVRVKSNSKLKTLSPELASLPLVGAGQNLVKNDVESWKGAVKNSLSPRAGMESFEIANSIFNSDVIPVDKANDYVLSGWFKNNGDSHLQYVYFSLMPLDTDKKQINAIEFNAYPTLGNETALTEPCAAGDTVLKIKDGTKWKESQNGCIAFDADDSGEFKDLPNRNLSSIGIKSVANKGDHWEVTLKSNCGKNFPSGTKVREQAASNAYIYPIIIKDLNKDDGWKRFECKLGGMTKTIVPANKFWPGTAFVRVGVCMGGPGNLIFSDIRFEEVK